MCAAVALLPPPCSSRSTSKRSTTATKCLLFPMQTYTSGPLPVLVLLHGAGVNGSWMLTDLPFMESADNHQVRCLWSMNTHGGVSARRLRCALLWTGGFLWAAQEPQPCSAASAGDSSPCCTHTDSQCRAYSEEVWRGAGL